MKPNKIIIAPSANKTDILKRTLNSDRQLLLGTEIVPLSVFRDNLVSYLPSQNREFTRLFSQVRQQISKENIYWDSLKFPAFFGNFYSFINELNKLSIPVDVLPDDDRKEILSWLDKQPLRSAAVSRDINKLENASNIEIYDYFYADYADRKDIDFLISKGARLVSLPAASTHKTSVRAARNSAREFGSIAQYLIKRINSEDFKLSDAILMVNNLETNAPVIEQVLSLYNIPYSITRKQKSEAIQSFISLLKLAYHPTADNFIDTYDDGSFKITDPKLIKYIEYLKLNFNQLLEPFKTIENWDTCRQAVIPDKQIRTYQDMLKGEQDAEAIMSPIREQLVSIINAATLKEKTATVFNLIKDNYESDEERECLAQLRELLQDCVPQLTDDEAGYSTVCYLADQIKLTDKDRLTDSLQITDVYRDVTNKKLAIVTGCSQDCFPKTINKDGFFDEYYLRNIEQYPSIDKRTAYFNDQLDKLFNRIPEVIFSYCTNDLEGKNNYKSTYLENKGPEEAWPYQENNTVTRKKQTIKPELAAKLYQTRKNKAYLLSKESREFYDIYIPFNWEKETIMDVSVSSLEKYVNCPFSYFLERGLKLNSEQWFQLDAGTMGTLQHSVLQQYFQDGRKIEDTLQTAFDAIKKLFINDSDLIDNMHQRLLTVLRMKAEVIDEAMQKGNWKPAEYERKIIRAEDFGTHKIIINGYIDRLDTNSNNEFMIVDYKSSKKAINDKSIANGTTLQLMTYLLAYSELQNNYQPYGAAYFDLKNEQIDSKTSDPDVKSLWRNNSRYDLYHLAGKADEDKAFYSSKKFTPDYDYYLKNLKEIYRTITARILSGNIAVTPTKNTCAYCDYASICHKATDEEINRKPILGKEDNEND